MAVGDVVEVSEGGAVWHAAAVTGFTADGAVLAALLAPSGSPPRMWPRLRVHNGQADAMAGRPLPAASWAQNVIFLFRDSMYTELGGGSDGSD
eukprot:gene4974-9086_t